MTYYVRDQFGLALKDKETHQRIKYVDRLGFWFSFPDPSDQDGPKIVTLHKHGEYEKVKSIMDEKKTQYEAKGLKDLSDLFRLLDFTHVNTEEINKLLDGCGLTEKNLLNLAPIEEGTQIIDIDTEIIEA